MQLLACKERLRWVRLSKERGKRNLASARRVSRNRAKRHRGSSIITPQHPVTYQKGKKIRRVRKRLTIPNKLCLHDNYDLTVNYVIGLREEVIKNFHAIFIDFSKLQHVTPDAALLLAAELDRWRLLRDIRLKVQKINKWHHEPRSVLQELGLFELLGVSNVPQGNNTISQLRIIKFSANSITDGQAAKQLRASLEDVSGLNIETSKQLYGGITEAMANVTQHAYPEEHNNKQMLKYWWLTGAYDASSGQLSIYMLDQGVGIPATLPNKYPMERLRSFLVKCGYEENDGAMIEASLAIGRTKTEKKYRGRGLENIMKFVKSNPMGELRILSRHGEYSYSSATNKSSHFNHSVAFPGTLIHWQINLKGIAI